MEGTKKKKEKVANNSETITGTRPESKDKGTWKLETGKKEKEKTNMQTNTKRDASKRAGDYDPGLQGEIEQKSEEKVKRKISTSRKKEITTTKQNWYKKEEPVSKEQNYRKGGTRRPKKGVG